MKKVIENFVPQGGKHCITNALKQVFAYYAYPLSEEMLFGISSGISFLYLNQSNAPMVCGRTKVFDFEKKLSQRLNIVIKCKSGMEYNRISQITRNMIDKDNPVLVYVDMPYLTYLGMDPNSHFGGHAVVLYGYLEVADLWDEVAECMWELSLSANTLLLRKMSEMILTIYNKEGDLYKILQNLISEVRDDI